MSGRSRSARTKPFCMGDNYINSLFKLLPSDLQKNDRLKVAIRNLKARSSRHDTTDLNSMSAASTRHLQSQDDFLKRNRELRDDLMKSIGELKTNIKDVQQLIEAQTEKLSTQNLQLDLLSNSVDEKINTINEEYKNVMLERTVTDALQVNLNLLNMSRNYGVKSDHELSTAKTTPATNSTSPDEPEITSAFCMEGDRTSDSETDVACDEVHSSDEKLISSYHDLAKKVRLKYDATVMPDSGSLEATTSPSASTKLVSSLKAHTPVPSQPQLNSVSETLPLFEQLGN